jgi:hypothetical protein
MSQEDEPLLRQLAKRVLSKLKKFPAAVKKGCGTLDFQNAPSQVVSSHHP